MSSVLFVFKKEDTEQEKREYDHKRKERKCECLYDVG